MRDTSDPITTEMQTATTAARAMALKVFSLNAESALVSKASEPMAHSFTCPTCSPEDVTISTLATLSEPVGADETGLCDAFFPLELLDGDSLSRTSAVALAEGHESS